MDIHIQLRKIGINGSPLAHNNYPVPVPIHRLNNSNIAKCEGPTGILRASHAVSQVPKQNEDEYPVYTHRVRRDVEKGTVVGLEIPIWPLGMVFDEGEGLEVTVSGHDRRLPEMEGLEPKEPLDMNVGKHILHTGGEQASFLMLPYLIG